jgi:hypothetical protein
MRTIVGSVALAVGAVNALAAAGLGFLFQSIWLTLGPASLATILLLAGFFLLRTGPHAAQREWLIVVPALLAGLAGGVTSACGTYSVNGDTQQLWVMVFGIKYDVETGPSKLMQAKMALWATCIAPNACVAVASAAGAIGGAFLRRLLGRSGDQAFSPVGVQGHSK